MSSLNSGAWLIASGLLDSTRELSTKPRYLSDVDHGDLAHHGIGSRTNRTLRQRLLRRSI